MADEGRGKMDDGRERERKMDDGREDERRRTKRVQKKSEL